MELSARPIFFWSARPKEAEMGLTVPKKITYHTTEKLF